VAKRGLCRDLVDRGEERPFLGTGEGGEQHRPRGDFDYARLVREEIRDHLAS
jgi:hypothetical protein